MRAREATRATLAQLEASDSWREATLPRPAGPRVRCTAASPGVAAPSGAPVVGLPPDGELARGIVGWGARLAARAGATGRAMEAETPHRIARHIPPWRPSKRCSVRCTT